MATLVLLAAAAPTTSSITSLPAGSISADQAMARYRSIVHDAIAGPEAGASCPEGESSDIVVCGRDRHPIPRLPMPEARAEPGEAAHHPGEPAGQDPGPPTGPPSKQAATLGKIFGLIREAITGEDPDQP